MSIDAKEKTQLLNLIPHFSDRWVVIDVGSNKGGWTDILLDERDQSMHHGKYEFHLLEPNELLLNYTRVKYDYKDNIHYHNLAASDMGGATDFYYFTNRNSGLSSVYNNPKWDELPKRHKVVSCDRLDHLFADLPYIDIIKIDVEGAEYMVLEGCKGLLENKKVKFIQVEYSEHYQLSGKTFKDIIRFAAQYGYHCYQVGGEAFDKFTEDTFIEDYHLDNFILSHEVLTKHHYTQDWNNEFKKNTYGHSFNFALEIGCFEGLTTNYICDHLLNTGGRMICVDPLEDLYLPEADAETNAMFVGQYQRFIRNTKGKPVELIRLRSQEAFPLLQEYLFDFVYIDGDHREEAVYQDGVEAFKLLRHGGIILFDDYLWRDETKRGIDRFLSEYSTQIKIMVIGYQVMIRKRKAR